MKKSFIFCMMILLLLSLASCSKVIDIVTGDGTIEYNNTVYNPVTDWMMITDDYKDVTISINGTNDKAKLYTDPEERFIFHEGYLGEALFFRSDKTLPSYEDENSVEKIVVDFYDDKKEDVVLYGDDMKSILSDMKNYSENVQKDRTIDSLGTVSIYFVDYPAYLFWGHFTRTRDGEYGIYKIRETTDGLSDGRVDQCALLSNQDLFD